MHRSVIEEYPQLYHYTTAIGLHGIVTSQQLWATHISYLNDPEEHSGFFDRRLPLLLEEPIRSALAEIGKTATGRNHINAVGGAEKATADLLRDLHANIRDITLSFNQPYVSSFCRALPGEVSEDGLLSQWRGYGPDGGYAIVFDTQRLAELLADEERRFSYQWLQWGDVEYYDDEAGQKAALPETQEWESALQHAIEQFILTLRREELEPVLPIVTALSCMHKHTGFREESEVRIVALPLNAEVLAEAQKKGENRPRKLARFAPRNGILVPYIALFERESGDEAARLPISKIIVGPHPERLKRQKAIELLLEQSEIRAEVTVSGIPYIGR